MLRAASRPTTSAWSPFRHAAFATLWVATVVSNIGNWLRSAASGWLMTDLNPSPLGSARRKDGGYNRGVYEDVAHPGRIVETFSLDSRIDHLRQHGRVTESDRKQQELVNRFRGRRRAPGDGRVTESDRKQQELVNRFRVEGAPRVTWGDGGWSRQGHRGAHLPPPLIRSGGHPMPTCGG
jgi:hypothetical protein